MHLSICLSHFSVMTSFSRQNLYSSKHLFCFSPLNKSYSLYISVSVAVHQWNNYCKANIIVVLRNFVLFQFVLVSCIINGVDLDPEFYPSWYSSVGICLIILSVISIPGYAMKKICSLRGSVKQVNSGCPSNNFGWFLCPWLE